MQESSDNLRKKHLFSGLDPSSRRLTEAFEAEVHMTEAVVYFAQLGVAAVSLATDVTSWSPRYLRLQLCWSSPEVLAINPFIDYISSKVIVSYCGCLFWLIDGLDDQSDAGYGKYMIPFHSIAPA